MTIAIGRYTVHLYNEHSNDAGPDNLTTLTVCRAVFKCRTGDKNDGCVVFYRVSSKGEDSLSKMRAGGKIQRGRNRGNRKKKITGKGWLWEKRRTGKQKGEGWKIVSCERIFNFCEFICPDFFAQNSNTKFPIFSSSNNIIRNVGERVIWLKKKLKNIELKNWKLFFSDACV